MRKDMQIDFFARWIAEQKWSNQPGGVERHATLLRLYERP